MNTHSAPLATSSQRARRVIALLIAVVLASLAFGVGLPWIIVDAPPETGTLWAREVQSRAPVAMPFAMPAAGSRSAAAALR